LSAPQSPRILSWQQLVLEADPNWQRDNLQPWIYEFSNRRLFYATIPMYGVPADTGLFNDNGVVGLEPSAAILFPDSPVGLAPGTFWNNGLTIGITPGLHPIPSAPQLFFSSMTATTLILSQSANIPISPANVGTDQLWNNNNLLSIGI
jgi:hypothetical protein